MTLVVPGWRRGCAAVLVLSTIGACAHVESSKARRGDMIRTRYDRSEVEHHYAIGNKEGAGDIAYVQDLETTCRIGAKEYQHLEDQTLGKPRAGWLGLGIGSMIGGGGLIFASTQNDSAPGMLAAIGVMSILFGGWLVISESVEKRDSEERTIVAATPDSDPVRDCSDEKKPLTGRLAWKLVLDGDIAEPLTGTTKDEGTLALDAPMLELLARVPADKLADVLDGPIEYRLTLGPVDYPATEMLSTVSIPDAWWAAWNDRYTKTLKKEEQALWAACTDVGSGYLVALECMDKKETSGRGFEVGKYVLEKTATGDYGWVGDAEGNAGDTVMFRVAPPADGTDWLLMVVDLETQAVIAEQFATGSGKQLLRVTLPKKSTYGYIAEAEKPATFLASIVTVSK